MVSADGVAEIIVAGAAAPLPPEVRDVVRWLAEQHQAGRSVTVRTQGSAPSWIGTQEAADLLRVSRPTVVKWLDTGILPSQRFGTHRRVRRIDVVAHAASRDVTNALDQHSTRPAAPAR